MSSLQCLKRVHLEAHHPELAHYSPQAEAAFAIGHRVGEVAIEVLGARDSQSDGHYIDYDGRSLAPALERTRDLMAAPSPKPIFEATLEHEGVLIREDLLFPTQRGSWRIVEVKASTSLKDEHVQDCAIQAWVHEGQETNSRYPLERIALAHVNNQFVLPAGEPGASPAADIFDGLFVEVDLTDEVRRLQRSVPGWVEAARSTRANGSPAATRTFATSPSPRSTASSSCASTA
jgi:hypothetical protein